MAKYIDAELLRKEINRRIELLTKAELDWFKQGDTETVLYYSGKFVALNEFANFIDSLSREQPSLPWDVDEAARKYGHEEPILPEGYNDGDIPLYERWTADVFKAGAKWVAEQGFISEGIINQTSDENTDVKELLHDEFMKGFEEGYTNAVNDAIKWLAENAEKYIWFLEGDCGINDDFEHDFKEAMK